MAIEKISVIPKGFAKWESDDGRIFAIKERSCLLCRRCTDVWIDYTNGPWMLQCTKFMFDCRKGVEGKCKYFKRDTIPNTLLRQAKKRYKIRLKRRKGDSNG